MAGKGGSQLFEEGAKHIVGTQLLIGYLLVVGLSPIHTIEGFIQAVPSWRAAGSSAAASHSEMRAWDEACTKPLIPSWEVDGPWDKFVWGRKTPKCERSERKLWGVCERSEPAGNCILS